MTLRIEGPTHTKDDKTKIADALRSIDGITYVRADMEREKGIYDYDVETDGKTDVRRAINKLCAEKGWNILMLQLSDMTLEDIFLKITMSEGITASDSSNAPKLEVKVKDGELIASEKTDDNKEKADAETAEETDGSENNGGEE